jgi:peptidoglycan hydrolase CwlO-like protein
MKFCRGLTINKKVIAFFIIASMLIPIVNFTSYAAGAKENKKKLEEINQKIKQNKSSLNQVNGKKLNVLKEMKTLDVQMNKIQQSIVNINNNINATNAKITKASKELKLAKKKAKKQKVKLYNRIETMYEMGNQSTLEVLLESKSISDFFVRIEILKDMAEYDNDILKKLKKIQKEIQGKKNVLVYEKNKMEKYKASAMSKKFGLDKTIEDRKKLVEVLNKKKNLYEDALDDLMKSSMEIEKQLQQVAKDSKVVYTGGVFSWPVPNCHLVTSPFGYRIHPITGTKKSEIVLDSSNTSNVLWFPISYIVSILL